MNTHIWQVSGRYLNHDIFLSAADWVDPSFWDNSESYDITTDLPADRKLQTHSQEVHYIATDQSANSIVCTVKVITTSKDNSCVWDFKSCLFFFNTINFCLANIFFQSFGIMVSSPTGKPLTWKQLFTYSKCKVSCTSNNIISWLLHERIKRSTQKNDPWNQRLTDYGFLPHWCGFMSNIK